MKMKSSKCFFRLDTVVKSYQLRYSNSFSFPLYNNKQINLLQENTLEVVPCSVNTCSCRCAHVVVQLTVTAHRDAGRDMSHFCALLWHCFNGDICIMQELRACWNHVAKLCLWFY